ncbi:MAG: serpin family protein [Thermoguttaceae bacterium]
MSGFAVACGVAIVCVVAMAVAADSPKTGDVSAVVEGNNQFALDLYAKLRGEQADNLFFSPYSISTALAMTCAGARGETEKQMAGVLHFPVPQDRIPSAFASLMAKLQSPKDGNQLRIANRLWGQQGYDFLPEFLRVTREQYKAELALLDFATKAEEARKVINAWVEKQTEEKIKDLIQPGVLDQMTRLVLTNAIYFKGKWASQFDKKATQEAPFKLTPTKTVTVPMMHRKDSFKYGAMDDAQILELPYVGEKLSMLVVLPKAVDGLADVEKRLTDLGKWLPAFRKQEVNVYLPRFTMTSQFQMNEALKSLGMASAFAPDAADFSGMDGKRDLSISAVIHKAFVDVNEEGTEAAAATGVVMRAKAVRITPVFRADHPFVFLIRDTGTGAILFVGRVVNPKG